MQSINTNVAVIRGHVSCQLHAKEGRGKPKGRGIERREVKSGEEEKKGMGIGRTEKKGKEKYGGEKRGEGRRGGEIGREKGEKEKGGGGRGGGRGEGEKGKNVMTRQKARSFLMFPLRSYHTVLQQESLSHFCSTML